MDYKKLIDERIFRVKQKRENNIRDLLIQIDRLKSEIEAQKEELKTELLETFDNLEQEIEKLPPQERQEAMRYLEERKLNSLEFLGILAETTEAAMITALERGENIQETIEEIAKALTHQTIDIQIDAKRIKDVTKTLLQIAANLAEASVNHADEILTGTITGIKEGLKKSIKKFNETIEFTPTEARGLIIQNYEEILKDLERIDAIYLEAIQEVAQKSEPGIKEKILSIAQESINLLEKIKDEAQIAIENIKRNLEDLVSSKNIDLTKKAEEAKRLGMRAFEIAKEKLENAIKGAKDAMHK